MLSDSFILRAKGVTFWILCSTNCKGGRKDRFGFALRLRALLLVMIYHSNYLENTFLKSLILLFIPSLSCCTQMFLIYVCQGWDDPYVPRTHEGLLKWKYAEMNSVDFLFEVVSLTVIIWVVLIYFCLKFYSFELLIIISFFAFISHLFWFNVSVLTDPWWPWATFS